VSEEGKNLKALRNELFQTPSLARWHPLIGEIFSSIKDGSHRIAIPAALTVLEGFVAHSMGLKDPSPIPYMPYADYYLDAAMRQAAKPWLIQLQQKS
jgi:hypothetical protein